MRIYTKTGDEGMTSLIGDRRLKSNIRVEAYGTIDELNSFVQLAVSKMTDNMANLKNEFMEISQLLFDCAGDFANVKVIRPYKITDESVEWLEKRIDDYIEQVEELQSFILPGGCELSAMVHICRTITRRAERRIVALNQNEDTNVNALKFINRLSDYFFITARVCNKISVVPDVVYKRSNRVFRGK